MNPPPPIPELKGWAAPAAKAVATAASMAFPPRASISLPASAAGPTEETTMPRFAQTGWGAAA